MQNTYENKCNRCVELERFFDSQKHGRLCCGLMVSGCGTMMYH